MAPSGCKVTVEVVVQVMDAVRLLPCEQVYQVRPGLECFVAQEEEMDFRR